MILSIKERFSLFTFFLRQSLSEMDVVPDGKDYLCEFIDSLGTGEFRGDEEVCTQAGEAGESNGVSSSKVTQSGVWSDIEEALHRWTDRILDAESRLQKTASFRESIEASLRRQQLDGLLNHQDIAELQHITNIWINLLNCVSSYSVGCDFVKRDIITSLIELYNLRQISKSLFIETCLQL